jgi:hypothetical protein
MPDGSERSLTDEQITSDYDYRTDKTFVPNLLRQLSALESRLEAAKGGREMTMSVEDFQSLSMGIRAMLKAQTELGGLSELSAGGDRGPGCDYNPFKGINF